MLLQIASLGCICACLPLGFGVGFLCCHILKHAEAPHECAREFVELTSIEQIIETCEGATSTAKLKSALSILPIYCVFINAWHRQHLSSQ